MTDRAAALARGTNVMSDAARKEAAAAITRVLHGAHGF
jgi:hypothetical protein